MIAIILAAGSGRRLNIHKPKGLLNIGGFPLIHYSINNILKTQKIEKIFIVTGYEYLKYERYINEIRKDITIEIVYNLKYAVSGSMYSLYLAMEKLSMEKLFDSDIVILDSDIIYNYNEFNDYIMSSESNAIFAADVPSDRYDACYIKADKNNILEQISKNINILDIKGEDVIWEHIGIIKTSKDTIEPIKDFCENTFKETATFQHEYDNIFENLNVDYKVCTYENYIWGEVDDDIQLKHMITNVYPKLDLF